MFKFFVIEIQFLSAWPEVPDERLYGQLDTLYKGVHMKNQDSMHCFSFYRGGGYSKHKWQIMMNKLVDVKLQGER